MGLCSCGHDLAEIDRFCSRCGAAATEDALVEDVPAKDVLPGPPAVALEASPPVASTSAQDSTGFDDSSTDLGTLLLDGPEAQSAESVSEVQSGPSGRWLVIGVVGIIALLLGLFAWPQAESEVEGAAGDLAEESDAESDQDEAVDEDAVDEEEAVEVDDGPPSETDESETASPFQESIEPADGATATGMNVGEETGLGLVVGSYNSSTIQLYDLDAGEAFRLPGGGMPVAVIDSTLVVERPTGRVAIVELLAPDQDLVTLEGGGTSSWAQFMGADDELLWVQYSGDDVDEEIIYGYDTDGEQRQTRELDIVPFLAGWTGDTSLVYNVAGGIYAETDDGYQRISTGSLVAVGENIALINECDDVLRCESRWVDRSSWDSLPYRAPDDAGSLNASYAILGSDRWLVETSWINGSTTVTDVTSGEVVREVSSFNGPFNEPAISDDGRWLFDPSGRSGVIVDLDSGTEWEQDVRLPDGATGVFVDLDETAFADR